MANLYRELQELLARTPLQVGTVEAISGSILRIRLDDGSVAKSRGAYPVGARVVFRAGGTVECEVSAGIVLDIPV